MAEFIFLFKGGDDQGSPESMQKHMAKWGAWVKELSASGNFKSGEPLERGGKIVRGREKVVTDGPFAEAKDVVGGFLLITADDLTHATKLAMGCPTFEVNGAVEVRPVAKMSM